ncbi:MAG: hypothetical protein H7X89_01545, partial [Rhizobiales bacterium]|nr:hypothetical protein [Hyphomicrobiales bacterium]
MRAGAVVLLLAFVLTASAAKADPFYECERKLSIQGCTEVIEQNEFSFEQKRRAFYNRGYAHEAQ